MPDRVALFMAANEEIYQRLVPENMPSTWRIPIQRSVPCRMSSNSPPTKVAKNYKEFRRTRFSNLITHRTIQIYVEQGLSDVVAAQILTVARF